LYFRANVAKPEACSSVNRFLVENFQFAKRSFEPNRIGITFKVFYFEIGSRAGLLLCKKAFRYVHNDKLESSICQVFIFVDKLFYQDVLPRKSQFFHRKLAKIAENCDHKHRPQASYIVAVTFVSMYVVCSGDPVI
jgi:hypothetical protein